MECGRRTDSPFLSDRLTRVEQTDLVIDPMQDGGRHSDAGEILAQIRFAQFNTLKHLKRSGRA